MLQCEEEERAEVDQQEVLSTTKAMRWDAGHWPTDAPLHETRSKDLNKREKINLLRERWHVGGWGGVWGEGLEEWVDWGVGCPPHPTSSTKFLYSQVPPPTYHVPFPVPWHLYFSLSTFYKLFYSFWFKNNIIFYQKLFQITCPLEF